MTMGQFRLSLRTEIDLAEIHRYISADNITAADGLIGGFFDLFGLLNGGGSFGRRGARKKHEHHEFLRIQLRSIVFAQKDAEEAEKENVRLCVLCFLLCNELCRYTCSRLSP